MPLLHPDVVRRAVDNVATWGDTDVFPLPIENHVMHDHGERESYRKLGSLPASPQVSGVMARVSDKTQGSGPAM